MNLGFNEPSSLICNYYYGNLGRRDQGHQSRPFAFGSYDHLDHQLFISNCSSFHLGLSLVMYLYLRKMAWNPIRIVLQIP